MDLVTVRELYRNREEYLDKEITVGGWVRSIRDSKAFGFIVVNDGSFFETLQVVYHDTMDNFEEISKLNVGAAIIVKGTLVATPQAKQPFEIQATEVTVEGASAPQVLRGQLSSALTRTNPENPFLARFCVQFLLTNLICRPDFISYKLADAGNPSVWLNHYLYRIPMAVWTLRNQKAYKTARNKYDMYIFEGFSVK